MTADNGWKSQLCLERSPAIENAFAYHLGMIVQVRVGAVDAPPRRRRVLARPAAAAPVQLVRGDRNTLSKIKGPDVSVISQMSPFYLFMLVSA